MTIGWEGRAAGAVALALALAAPALAGAAEGGSDWTLRTRGVLSGSSGHSEPAGYEVYSAFAVEAALDRRLGAGFSLEASIRTESREVDFGTTRLGSLELLPMNLLVQYAPFEGTWRPYLGVGLNFTPCWEKSGGLDDTQVGPSVGPAVQLGLDLALSAAVALDLDVRWNVLRPEVRGLDPTPVTLQVDPLTLAVGVAVRL